MGREKYIPNETLKKVLKDCVEKIDGINDYDWTEIIEKYNLDIARDTLRKSMSAPTGGYRIYKLMEEEMKENLNNPTSEQIEELKTLKYQIADQRRELRKYERSYARFKHLCEIVDEGISKLNEKSPLISNYKPTVKTSKYTNEGVLICSDWHLGAKFKNILGEYSLDIAIKEIKKLLIETIDYCKFNKVKTLHVELLGDMINGAIRTSAKVEAEEDVISQIMDLIDILEDFIKVLSDNISNVKVYTAIGNHSRLVQNKDENQEGENFERLIPYALKRRFKDCENVEICDSANLDDCIVKFNVINEVVFGVHGDLDKPVDVVDNMIKMFKVFPTEVHMGHYHSDLEKTEYDVETVVNGSLQGTDNYAKRIRKSGKPLQKLRIYNEKGCLCEYKIKL